MRVIYDQEMPKELQKKLRERLNTKELDASLAGGKYQNHKDLMSFPNCGHKELKYEKWGSSIMKPEFLSNLRASSTRFVSRTVSSTYHIIVFNGYIRVLREAATKPEVKAIKTTLYRLAKD